MNVKNLFLSNGIICLLFAIPVLLMPNEFLSHYQVEGDVQSAVAQIMSRAYGALLVGIGAALLTSLKAQASYGRKALLLLIALADLIQGGIYLHAIMTGMVNSMVWSSVVITTFFGIWAAVLWSKETVGTVA